MSRDILKIIEIKNKKRNKFSYELLTELSNHIPKKEIAKKLKISDRTLRGYYDYMRKEIGISEIDKNSRKPPSDLRKKLSTISKKYGIKLTTERTTLKSGVQNNTTTNLKELKNLFDTKTKDSISKLKKKKDFFGYQITATVLMITSKGAFTDYITKVYPKTININLMLKAFKIDIANIFAHANSLKYWEIKNISITAYGKIIKNTVKTKKSKKVRKNKK